MTATLLPCPFCGDDQPALDNDTSSGAWEVRCTHCGISIGNYAGERSARSAWGRRAANQQGEGRCARALAELVACDKLTRDYIMTGRVPANYGLRFEAAWAEARAAVEALKSDEGDLGVTLPAADSDSVDLAGEDGEAVQRPVGGAPSLSDLGIVYQEREGWHMFETPAFPGVFVTGRDLAKACTDVLPSLANLVELDARAAMQTKGLLLTPAQVNHLWRLVGWVRCEIWQSPEELVATVRSIAPQLQEITEEGKARLVEQHVKASNVPKYIRAAVKALGKAAGMAFTSDDDTGADQHAAQHSALLDVAIGMGEELERKVDRLSATLECAASSKNAALHSKRSVPLALRPPPTPEIDA